MIVRKPTTPKPPVKKANPKKSEALKPIEALKNAKTILLIDWPDKSLPLALLKAGFMVISYSPDKYTLLSYETNYAEGILVFSVLEGLPGQVEIVNIFRPEEEHEEIINRQALPLRAKTVWLHPPVISSKTATLAKKHRLRFVQGHNIAEVAAGLSAR